MIFSLILRTLSTLFIEINSPWLISGSVKASEIKTSDLFNLVFAKNTILSCYFLFFLIADVYFLISAIITQTFSPTAELAIPAGITTTEKKVEFETQLVKVEAKTSKCSIQFRVSQVFLCFLLTNYVLFLLKNNLFFIDFFQSKVKGCFFLHHSFKVIICF